MRLFVSSSSGPQLFVIITFLLLKCVFTYITGSVNLRAIFRSISSRLRFVDLQQWIWKWSLTPKIVRMGRTLSAFALLVKLGSLRTFHITVCKTAVHRNQIWVCQVQAFHCMQNGLVYSAALGCPNINRLHCCTRMLLSLRVMKHFATCQLSIYCATELN